MRLFIAVFPPKEHLDYYRDVLRYFSKQKRNLRPIPVDQTHLTLKFIGSNVSEDSKNMIAEQLLAWQGSYPKPEINVRAIKFGFANQSSPRHLIAAIERNNELDELGKMVHEAVKAQKQRDTIRWKTKYSKSYHITLAKLKDTATNSSGKLITSNIKNIKIQPPKAFVPEEMFLIESLTSRSGTPIYRRIERIKL